MSSDNSLAGVFPVCLVLQSNTPLGAPLLTLKLLVNPASKNITGVGLLTQATNPPLRIEFNSIRGRYQQDGDVQYVYFEGASFPGPGGYSIRGQMRLENWQNGVFEYTLVHGGVLEPATNVEGKVTPCE